MSSVISAFVASMKSGSSRSWFIDKCKSFDMLVTTDENYQNIEFSGAWDKLMYQLLCIKQDEFIKLVLSKKQIELYKTIEEPETLFNELQLAKKKRNSGDSLKHIVTDNWK
jgi:hypothetical protein